MVSRMVEDFCSFLSKRVDGLAGKPTQKKGRKTGPFLLTKIFFLHVTMAKRRRENYADLY